MREWTDFARQITDPSKAHKKPEALEGIRVLDLSHGSFAGLFASSLLAEFGAEVIRIRATGRRHCQENEPRRHGD